MSAALQFGMLVIGLRGYSAQIAGTIAALAAGVFTLRPQTRRSWLGTPVVALAGAILASVAVWFVGTGLVEVPQGELLIGGATLILAVATLLLGVLTRTSELERRREAQILDVHPLAVDVDSYSPVDAPQRTVTLRAANDSQRPSLDVTGTIHYEDRLGRNAGAMSPAGYGVIHPGASALLKLELGGSEQTSFVIEVESRGLMGQRVTQTYRWLIAGITAGERSVPDSLTLTRVVIEPTVGLPVVIDHDW